MEMVSDGDTQEGPQSHNQMGAVDELPTEEAEEHTALISSVDPEKPSEGKDPSAGTSEKTTGAVVEESAQLGESVGDSGSQSGIDNEEGNGLEQNQSHNESPEISQLPNIEEDNQSDSKGSLELPGSTDDEKIQNEPTKGTATADSDVKYEDQTNDANNLGTTDLIPADIINDKTSPETITQDQEKPTESYEETASKEPVIDENVPSTLNTDDSGHHPVVTDENESNNDGSNDQNLSDIIPEQLPTKPQETDESELSLVSEDNSPHKSGTENDVESQPPSQDENHDNTISSESVTEISSGTDKTEDISSSAESNISHEGSPEKHENDELSEENSYTAKPEENVDEEQTINVQDPTTFINEDNSPSISEQENQTVEQEHQHASEEASTNEENGDNEESINLPEDIEVKPTETSVSNEGNNETPSEESDNKLQDKNEENFEHEGESDSTSIPINVVSEETIKENNDVTEEENVPIEHSPTETPFDQSASQTDKINDESLEPSDNVDNKHDQISETEVSEIEDHSPSESPNEEETVSQETTGSSSSSEPSVGESEKEESSEVVKEPSSVSLPSEDSNEDTHENESLETTNVPIVEDQGLSGEQATESPTNLINDSHALVTENNLLESSESINDHQSENTETSDTESESGTPDSVSHDGSLDNVEQTNNEVITDDNAEESVVNNEEKTDSSIGPDNSLVTGKPPAEHELSSEMYIESTKEPDTNEASISTEGYKENEQSPESDDIKIGQDSESLQPIDHEHDSVQELDTSSNPPVNSESAVIVEEEVNNPVHEGYEHNSESEPTNQDGQSSSVTEKTDQTNLSSQEPNQEEQSQNTPDQAHDLEDTPGTTDQPTEISVGSEETKHSEGELVQGESEIPLKEPESSQSVVEPVQEIEGANVIESDHKDSEHTDEDSELVSTDEGGSADEKVTSVNESEVPVTVPEIEDEKQSILPENGDVESSIQVEDSQNSNNNEHPTLEHEHTDQEVVIPGHDIEPSNEQVEHQSQEVEHTNQQSDNTSQSTDHNLQESDNNNHEPIQSEGEIEHSVNVLGLPTQEPDHIPEQSPQESEQPEHSPEESTQEAVDIPQTSGGTQDMSSLPIPSEETHSVENEPKPDLTKPDDSEISSEDQFPSSPDMDYDGSEDGAFGPGTCRYGGKVYVSAQQIPRDDPCDFCFCFRSDIICLQQSCPPPIHRCHQEPIQGYCCPRYQCPVSMATSLNLTTTTTTTTTTLPPHFFAHAYLGAARQAGCLHKGRAFSVGEEITTASGPCLHCM